MGRTGRAKDRFQQKKVDIPPLLPHEAFECIVDLAQYRHDRRPKSSMGVIQQNEIDAIVIAADALRQWLLSADNDVSPGISTEHEVQLERLLKANKLILWREMKGI